MIEKERIIELLKDQVKPALGCTEPVAVAIAVSRAYSEVEGNLKSVKVITSPNIYKNGMRVGIPGTPEAGLLAAVALAIVNGDWKLGLEVFDKLSNEDCAKAKKLMESGIISVEPTLTPPSGFYISAEVKTDKGVARCEIRDSHTNIVLVEKDGKAVFTKEPTTSTSAKKAVISLKDYTFKEVIESVEAIPYEDIKFMFDGVDMNMKIANAGLATAPEKNVGSHLMKLIKEGKLPDDVINRARAITSAGSDARMSGEKLPVMSSAGSGNHGLTAILPVYLIGKDMGASDEKIAKAIAISHLATNYIKEYTGKLSPICGCAVAAGTGASIGIAWLMGADERQITGTFNNMIGSIAGLICDGAKRGCALKLATAASEAIIAARMAMNGFIVPDMDGILGNSFELSVKNLGKLSAESMQAIDPKIIEIMVANDKVSC